MGAMEEITGTIPYMFIDDNSVEEGMGRIARRYPSLTVELRDARPLGTSLTLTGSWGDVFLFLVEEYDGCDADDALANVAMFKPTYEED